MMHYKPWINPQQMLMEQNPFYQCVNNVELQTFYSSSDHQEEENDHTGDEMPSETSGDQSPNTDVFRLAFAASQWSKLVLNAEGLFNKLMAMNVLSQNEQNLLKNQIEQWLCMKQEYEECIVGDDSGSLQGYTENTRRSLERIEEVTETDEKTDESCNWKLQSRSKSCSGSESEASDDEDQSDTESESENPDFLDKLDEYMKRFKIETDELVDSVKNDFSKLKSSSPVPKQSINGNFVPIVKPVPIRNPTSRRVSILPNSEMSDEIMEFQKRNSNINMPQKDNHDTSLSSISSLERNDNYEKFSKNLELGPPKMVIKTQNLNVDSEYFNAIRILLMNNEEKQLQVKKINSDMSRAYRQFQELQITIKDKEQFIHEMLQNCSARNNAKQIFDKKQIKLEEKCRNIEKILNFKQIQKNVKSGIERDDEVDKYESMLTYYQKKLKDTKMIKEVVGESAKTLIQAKESLGASRKQLEKLKEQLEDEEKRRKVLEDEIRGNEKKIKEFKEKQDPNVLKLKELISEGEDAKNNTKYKTRLDDKEKRLVEVNERVSHLDHLVKEELETKKIDSNDKSGVLREEIISLRIIRDCLLEAKNKIASDKYPCSEEQQRQLLLIDEYVETIDLMMEHKNVMICNNGNFNENKSEKIEEKMLCYEQIMNRLEILSHDELVNLFDKYFYKVIDLKEGSRSLEIQNIHLEDALKNLKIKSDAKIMKLQKFYQRQLTHFYNYYAEETSSSSYDAKIDKNKDFVEQLIKENQALKKRLSHFETLFKTSRAAQAIQSNSVKSTKQVLKPELMQIALPTKPKVTRQGNKLIIQK